MGAAGTNEADGNDGADGSNGTNGDAGADGTDGDGGANGTDGTDGSDGSDGIIPAPVPIASLNSSQNASLLTFNNQLSFAATFSASNLDSCSSRDCRIISKATGTAEQAHDWMLSTIAVGNEARLRFRLKINGVTRTLIASTGNIVDDNVTVYNAVATFDVVSMKLYLDGQLVGVRIAGGIITPTSNGPPTFVGSNDGLHSKEWQSLTIAVDVYDVALTQAQIQAL